MTGESNIGKGSVREESLPPLQDPLLQRIRSDFEREYHIRYGEESGKGLYKDSDWCRIQFAIGLVPDLAKSVLDVGVGPGALLNYLVLSERFDRVTGIDKRRYSKFVSLTPKLDLRIMDVANATFPDDCFDLVFCMEVLEHLDDESLPGALSQLRRITNGRLVMTVPFNEPKPLPSYHLQHFDEARIRSTFPNADMILLHRNKTRSVWPWAVLIESR